MQKIIKLLSSVGIGFLTVCLVWMLVMHGLTGVAWFICFLAVIYCAIIAHEFAHAIVGHALGMHIHTVSIGRGPKLYSARLWGVELAFHLLPLGGETLASLKVIPGFRLRHCLHTLAGPLSSLALCACIFPLYSAANEQLDFWYDTPFSLSGLLAATLFLLAFLGLGSLVPFRQRVDQHERWSDGFHVRCALELAPTEIENQVSLYYVRRANENETAGHAQAAEQWYATGFRRFPNNETLLMDYVRFLCRTGDSHAACNYATKALAQPVSDIPRFVRVLDSFACVPLYYHSPELLPLADECSKRALELSPSELTLKGTRGGVLVELGRIAEGTALLQECLEQSRSANDQAISASFLALAALREGNRERAHQLLGQAERILATKPAVVDKVFQRVKAELAR